VTSTNFPSARRQIRVGAVPTVAKWPIFRPHNSKTKTKKTKNKTKGQRGLTICLDKLQQVCERQSCTILTEDVWRPNFFFSGLTFFAELAQEYAQDLATVVPSRITRADETPE
jgi:hypothetical protein